MVYGICLFDSLWFHGFGLQAYQVELESLAVKLEEENERLLKEKVKSFVFNFFNLGGIEIKDWLLQINFSRQSVPTISPSSSSNSLFISLKSDIMYIGSLSDYFFAV